MSLQTVEVEGWTAADEYVSAIVTVRPDETREQAIDRAIREENIVEIGSTS